MTLQLLSSNETAVRIVVEQTQARWLQMLFLAGMRVFDPTGVSRKLKVYACAPFHTEMVIHLRLYWKVEVVVLIRADLARVGCYASSAIPPSSFVPSRIWMSQARDLSAQRDAEYQLRSPSSQPFRAKSAIVEPQMGQALRHYSLRRG